jgi:hemerythrin-like domain-containing protein
VTGCSHVVAHDRRRALALVGVAGFAVAGCARAIEKSEVTANEDLMREHGVLRRILIVYRELAPRIAANAAAIDAGAIAAAAALFRQFGERYHEQLLEEQHIFPAVRKAGGNAAGLVDTLLAQHARGREITDYMIEGTKTGRIGDGPALAAAMTAFTRMYEAHAAREDTIVFPAFKQSLGDKAYRELGEQFEDIEHRTFGGDGFDIALGKVADI